MAFDLSRREYISGTFGPDRYVGSVSGQNNNKHFILPVWAFLVKKRIPSIHFPTAPRAKETGSPVF
jgi:hypothetical protein